MKLHASPLVWVCLGFLTGWLYAKPGIGIGIAWAVSHYALTIWILNDVEKGQPRIAPP